MIQFFNEAFYIAFILEVSVAQLQNYLPPEFSGGNVTGDRTSNLNFPMALKKGPGNYSKPNINSTEGLIRGLNEGEEILESKTRKYVNIPDPSKGQYVLEKSEKYEDSKENKKSSLLKGNSESFEKKKIDAVPIDYNPSSEPGEQLRRNEKKFLSEINESIYEENTSSDVNINIKKENYDDGDSKMAANLINVNNVQDTLLANDETLLSVVKSTILEKQNDNENISDIHRNESKEEKLEDDFIMNNIDKLNKTNAKAIKNTEIDVNILSKVVGSIDGKNTISNISNRSTIEDISKHNIKNKNGIIIVAKPGGNEQWLLVNGSETGHKLGHNNHENASFEEIEDEYFLIVESTEELSSPMDDKLSLSMNLDEEDYQDLRSETSTVSASVQKTRGAVDSRHNIDGSIKLQSLNKGQTSQSTAENLLQPSMLVHMAVLESLASAISGNGYPGRDYPILSRVPHTKFSCLSVPSPGYYVDSDPQARCQVFHICQEGGRMNSFLCPNGTLFNQQYLVCDWWYNVDCEYYFKNNILKEDIARDEGMEATLKKGLISQEIIEEYLGNVKRMNLKGEIDGKVNELHIQNNDFINNSSDSKMEIDPLLLTRIQVTGKITETNEDEVLHKQGLQKVSIEETEAIKAFDDNDKEINLRISEPKENLTEESVSDMDLLTLTTVRYGMVMVSDEANETFDSMEYKLEMERNVHKTGNFSSEFYEDEEFIEDSYDETFLSSTVDYESSELVDPSVQTVSSDDLARQKNVNRVVKIKTVNTSDGPILNEDHYNETKQQKLNNNYILSTSKEYNEKTMTNKQPFSNIKTIERNRNDKDGFVQEGLRSHNNDQTFEKGTNLANKYEDKFNNTEHLWENQPGRRNIYVEDGYVYPVPTNNRFSDIMPKFYKMNGLDKMAGKNYDKKILNTKLLNTPGGVVIKKDSLNIEKSSEKQLKEDPQSISQTQERETLRDDRALSRKKTTQRGRITHPLDNLTKNIKNGTGKERNNSQVENSSEISDENFRNVDNSSIQTTRKMSGKATQIRGNKNIHSRSFQGRPNLKNKESNRKIKAVKRTTNQAKPTNNVNNRKKFINSYGVSTEELEKKKRFRG